MFKTCCGDCGECWYVGNPRTCTCPDETTKRTWVELTNKEFAEILCDDRWQGRPELMMLQVQAKLKEKNNECK